jgi:hypothetical protein
VGWSGFAQKQVQHEATANVLARTAQVVEEDLTGLCFLQRFCGVIRYVA